MRSASHSRFGDPAEVLVLADTPLPQPSPGQVRIRTILSPIHNHDLLTVRGEYGYRPALPAIGGSEAVGVVDALGEGVEGVAAGQRVAVAGVHGTWAEGFLAPAAALVPLPQAMEDGAAAQLLAMPLSAIMLLEFLQVEAGQWIVQNTANGAVGKTQRCWRPRAGSTWSTLVRRDAGIDEMAALGIGNTVSTAQPDWQARVRALTGGAPLRAAVDSVGGAASAQLLGLLGEGGVLVAFGAMSGESMQVPAGELIFRGVVVKGFWASAIGASTSARDRRRLVTELIQHVLAGELRLGVEAIYDLADVAQAAAASLQPGRTGKVMLRP
ncbi:zinc-binding dehydrogenase [Pseudoxanthomonas sp. NC8]|nr:zinc-binding dehydrogenase [Pseudoxanthomonas sp. NC8]